MKFIIGKKLDMTQVWRNDEVTAVTRVQAGPCTVVQVKNSDNDGYEAVQLGYGKRKEKNIAKPQKGHLKDLGNLWHLREFRIEKKFDKDKAGKKLEIKRGDKIDVSAFAVGDIVHVTGITKGRGFQGVVKRHGFHGQSKTHGNKDQLRMPGSIGATGPAHVFKGMRMPGRMGGEQETTGKLKIVDVDNENNILLIKGSVPGARNGLLLIAGEGELKVSEKLSAEAKAGADKEAGSKNETINTSKQTTDKVAKKKAEDNSKEKTEDKVEEKTEDKKETPEKVEKDVVEAKEKVDNKKESTK